MESKVATKKQTKPTTAAATPAVAATPAAAPVTAAKKTTVKAAEPVAATPAVEASTVAVAAVKKSTKKSSDASTVATPSVAGTTTEATATETKVEVDSHEELETLANDLIKLGKRVLEASRQARKDFTKQVKKAEQGGKRRHRKADGETSHSNSVFLQPCKVSPALATFCGVASDAMISRTEATRAIAAYIKKHNLQNPENRREIRADATLTKLFALGAEDKLNYFNLQRYIKPHFIKEVKA